MVNFSKFIANFNFSPSYSSGYNLKLLPTKPGQPKKAEQRLARKGLMLGLRTQGKELKVSLIGKLNGNSSRLFKEFMGEVLAQGHVKIDLDLAGLSLLDGAGLAALTWCHYELAQQSEGQGQLVLSKIPQSIRSILIATNLQYLISLGDYDYLVASPKS